MADTTIALESALREAFRAHRDAGEAFTHQGMRSSTYRSASDRADRLGDDAIAALRTAFSSLREDRERLEELATLKHGNELRARNDRLAANNNALNARATKAEARVTALEVERDALREAMQFIWDALDNHDTGMAWEKADDFRPRTTP